MRTRTLLTVTLVVAAALLAGCTSSAKLPAWTYAPGTPGPDQQASASGNRSTLPVSVDDMVYHTACVARGLSRALLVADMPFLSFATLDRELRAAAQWCEIGLFKSVTITADPKNVIAVLQFSPNGG